jgi:dipeptidyl aminopeptidase/acylaminoacyl peptidase
MIEPRRLGALLGLSVLLSTPVARAGDGASAEDVAKALERRFEALDHRLDELQKQVDDVLWFTRLGDVAHVDKVLLVGPPNPKEEERYGIANQRHPFRFRAYTFVPRKGDAASRRPLLVFPHGGVHADFSTYYVHVVRELIDQGYVVVAPEYRGSTGYGRAFYEAIDYGGLEVGDNVAARDWAVENLEGVDPKRVGILGWSHGGLIALLAAFDHPDKFQVAYAGVPVSDLVARMGYQDQAYRDLYEAPYHIGKPAIDDVMEYRRRSPVFHVEKLRVPLLVHTTTNDRDVHVLEVEHLIQALKAAGKSFEHKVYEDAPGGHSFNRTDTRLARESRREVYAFLGRYLEPSR